MDVSKLSENQNNTNNKPLRRFNIYDELHRLRTKMIDNKSSKHKSKLSEN